MALLKKYKDFDIYYLETNCKNKLHLFLTIYLIYKINDIYKNKLET